MRVAITGVTGLIGRNLLFEIIKQNINSLDKLEIVILGRSKNNMSIKERIEKIICEDGLSYLSVGEKGALKVKGFCDTNITYIETNLEEEKLGIDSDGIKSLKRNPIDFFFHLGASTDLRDTPAVIKILKKANIYGTQQILELASVLDVKEFCYTGTAYACGETHGIVKPDIVNTNQRFRGPYEQAKLEAEILVRKFEKKYGIRCRYFRPSSVCGRLLESPLGATSKFDVFYGWGAFFFQMKLKHLENGKDKYKEPATLNVRICYNDAAGLNIVPVDYAAKVMYQLCIQNDPGSSYHLVNNQECPHGLYLLYMIKALTIQGVVHVGKIPEQMNRFERLYYKTAGKVFTPYINAQPMLFDAENLKGVCKKANLSCPPIDEKTLPILIKYAKEHDFGVIKNYSASKTASKAK